MIREIDAGWEKQQKILKMDYHNAPKEDINFECRKYGYIVGVLSVFSEHDRAHQFKFQCDSYMDMVTDKCKWTDYLNKKGKSFTSSCSDNEVIAGMASDFPRHGDGHRRWKIKCCEVR